MSASLENERQQVKRKAADVIETVYDATRPKKQLKSAPKRKRVQQHHSSRRILRRELLYD